MRDWLQSLERREQWLLSLAGLAVLASLFFVLVSEPMQLALEQAENRYRSASDTQAEVQQMATQAQQLLQQIGSGSATGTSDNLLPLIERSLRQAGIADVLKRMTPEPSGAVRLQFDEIAFNSLYAWLQGLKLEHGVDVHSLSLNATSTPGRVRALLTLD